jgi:hypothetical protein
MKPEKKKTRQKIIENAFSETLLVFSQSKNA